MILDCGGGTVDVTVHSLVTNTPFRLNELAPPSGGPWGSTYVDAAFCKLLREMIGAANYDRITKRMVFLELMVRRLGSGCAAARAGRILGPERCGSEQTT